jgi:MinD-like ATPase involved in chromosome partitioning or flagellar assembly
LDTIDLVRKNLNHPLSIAGALLTMYDKREKLSREVAREIRKRFPYHVYDVEIPRSVALAEAPSYQKPVMLYAPQSPGAMAYEALAREIITGRKEEAVSRPIERISESFALAPVVSTALMEKAEEELEARPEPFEELPEPFILHLFEDGSGE